MPLLKNEMAMIKIQAGIYQAWWIFFFKGFGSFVCTHITAPVSLKRKLLLHILSNMANINLALHPIEKQGSSWQ